jgi:tetratricopeptide (TPR) repeat protein
MTLEHRPAETLTITDEEFVQAVIAGHADSAISKVRSVKETQPNHILLDEEHLNRIVYSLRGTWGLDKEILPLLEFIVELYPTSSNALYMLAEGKIVLTEYSAAIEIYERLLVLDPDDKDNYIKRRLEWLQSQ